MVVLGEAIVMRRSGIGREKRMMRVMGDAIAAGNRMDVDMDWRPCQQKNGGA